jgi:hypothetical protein
MTAGASNDDPTMPDIIFYKDGSTEVQDLPPGTVLHTTPNKDGGTDYTFIKSEDKPPPNNNTDGGDGAPGGPSEGGNGGPAPAPGGDGGAPADGGSKEPDGKQPAPKEPAAGGDPKADEPKADEPKADEPKDDKPKDGGGPSPAPDSGGGGDDTGGAGKQDGKAAEPKQPEGKTPEAAGPQSNYKKGQTVDDDFLDKAAKVPGAKESTEDGKRTVTLPDGTKYTEGEKLTPSGADKAQDNGIKHDDKEVGNYHAGDPVTPELEQQLKDAGYTEDGEGHLVSPDGKTVIDVESKKGSGGAPPKLSETDANAINEGGIKKTDNYEKNKPQPVNSETMTEDELPPSLKGGDPYNPPRKIENQGANQDVTVVLTYNKTTNEYEPAGEISPPTADHPNGEYFPYSDDQKEKIENKELAPGYAGDYGPAPGSTPKTPE